MNVLIIDTSVWIDALRGETIPALEEGLQMGCVYLLPLVYSELLSGTCDSNEEKKIENLLKSLPLIPTDRTHWKAVGNLRSRLMKHGVTVSIPDCHIAQCTLDIKGRLISRDKIFNKIADIVPLKLGAS